MKTHVAFIQSEPLARIKSGMKTVECRLSVNRPLAWNTQPGDFILFKETGGEIKLRARVEYVLKFESLTPTDIQSLAELVQPFSGAETSAYFTHKSKSRYAVIIGLIDVTPIEFPASATPRGIQSAWVSNFPMAHLATD
jgi:ASC-1-like (ASCH) protein